MASLAALAAKVSGAKFALTDYVQIKTNLDWLAVAGANLASAATINPTAEFHIVTGTNTIDTITLATLTPAVGQTVELLLQSALTIRNNGGGTGNIRTQSGKDLVLTPNALVAFVYDGTVWRELVQARPGDEFDYAQITSSPAAVTATTEGTATTIITGAAVTYDGSTRIRLEAFFPAIVGTTSSTKMELLFLRDSTVLGRTTVQASTVETGPVYCAAYDTPAAGAHTYKVAAFVTASMTLIAGAGGAGAYLPAFLRATRA